jgi:hypothetical protein
VDRVPFGRFALVEPRGSMFGHVMLAPEFILLQRASHTSIHDVSYLVVWSEKRVNAIVSELAALAGDGAGVVSAATPEVSGILRAIAPTSTPLFLNGGDCRHTLRAFTRRALETGLRDIAMREAVTAGPIRKVS